MQVLVVAVVTDQDGATDVDEKKGSVAGASARKRKKRVVAGDRPVVLVLEYALDNSTDGGVCGLSSVNQWL